MKFRYRVRQEDLQNIQDIERNIKKAVRRIEPTGYVLELDYSDIVDPQVTLTTAILIQRLIKLGFAKVVVSGHKFKNRFREQPICNIYLKHKIIDLL